MKIKSSEKSVKKEIKETKRDIFDLIMKEINKNNEIMIKTKNRRN